MANDFGFNDYNQLFAQYAAAHRAKQKDNLAWLDPALTAAGAAIGTVLLPGAGTAAGASLGHAAGQVGHSAANGNAEGAVMGAAGLPAAWSQFAPFIGTFAEGGPVPDPWDEQYGVPAQPQDQQQPLSMLTPELIAQIQQHAQTLAGQAPGRPTVENGGLAQTRTASHPTLEALATLMPTLLGSLPKPANPKNTKAIGAWAPFAGNVMAAPALIAQSRRKAANAPIEDANTQAQSDYEARQKAYEDQKKAYGTALIQGAMRPQGQPKETKLERYQMPLEDSVRKGLGAPEWVKTYGHLDEWQQMQQRAANERAASGVAGRAADENSEIEQFAQDVASLSSDPTISMTGRSAPYGVKAKNRVNQVLREAGKPYTYQQLVQYWNDNQKFLNTQEGQRFQNLRQSAITVRKHLETMRQFYSDLSKLSAPAGIRTIGKGKFALAMEGVFGPEIQGRANQLAMAQDVVASEAALLLAGGYAPKQEQVQNAYKRMQVATMSQHAGEQTIRALENILRARIEVWQQGAPVLGGKKNPYFMGVAPLPAWDESGSNHEEPVVNGGGESVHSGYVPPGGVKPVKRKGN